MFSIAGKFCADHDARYAGWVLQTLGTYTPIFIVSGCAYLVALLVVHLINPSYARVTKFGAGNA